MKHTVCMPALSEDGGNAKVTSIMVELGDAVNVDDPILEIETDKVIIEVPSSHAGIVDAIHVCIGDEISRGAECLTLNEDFNESHKLPEPAMSTMAVDSQKIEGILSEAALDVAVKMTQVSSQVESQQPTGQVRDNNLTHEHIPAGPGSRRLARELGIDIAELLPEDYGSRISPDDVKFHAKCIIQSAGSKRKLDSSMSISKALPDITKFGPTRTEKLSRISSVTSQNMSNAWSTIPHAWLQEIVDITTLEEWRQQQKSTGVKLSITAIITKALAVATQQFPKMNSSFDEQNKAIVYKDYIDVGIAVDTPHGLVVPCLRGVDQKNLTEISANIADLSKKSNERKLKSNDLQGSGITLSNLGGIGLSSIFPIVNWPQVAIVGVAGSQMVPKIVNGALTERRVITLTLGFDHRVINGAEGARFLVHIKHLLEDIRRLII